MSRSLATVPTEHASRYLQQLCKHWAHKFPVEFTPDAGTIDLPAGRTELNADGTGLRIAITAGEGGDLDRLESVVADHIRRFAFREELVFDWRRGS